MYEIISSVVGLFFDIYFINMKGLNKHLKYLKKLVGYSDPHCILIKSTEKLSNQIFCSDNKFGISEKIDLTREILFKGSLS